MIELKILYPADSKGFESFGIPLSMLYLGHTRFYCHLHAKNDV
ncbi:hypothetical protein PGH07_05385 [Sulfurovum sp. zt1-1]|uniref:Uncharacterized protein n=1 Tax=Sulfurovum zhangzhouensis TaxID=3019067 RepID=A0ABT7QYL1_9BACT|nr:hypothetical protein [Sulfurovum zhangzhouensis]